MKISTYKTDLNAAEDGVVFPMSEPDENGKFATVKIAKWNNKKHSAFLKEFRKIHGTKLKHHSMSDSQFEYLIAEQFEYILVGFDGFEDDDNESINYSPTAVIDLARNPQYKDFFDKVAAISQDESNFRAESVKALGEASHTS
jgi:hypothetical protein